MFLQDMGEPLPGQTLDRKKNYLRYFPENCQWATKKQQAVNRSSTTRVIIDGESRALPELAEEHGIPCSVLYNRVKRGWDINEALHAPVRVQ